MILDDEKIDKIVMAFREIGGRTDDREIIPILRMIFLN